MTANRGATARHVTLATSTPNHSHYVLRLEIERSTFDAPRWTHSPAIPIVAPLEEMADYFERVAIELRRLGARLDAEDEQRKERKNP